MALRRKRWRYESEVEYVFRCWGCPNIRAKHGKTIEFTRDDEIGIRADCVIGIRADFELGELKKFKGKILISVECGGVVDEFHAIVNPNFSDDREVVLRKSRYSSARTFGVMLNKGADGLKRDIAKLMRNPEQEMIVRIFQKPVRKIVAE